MPTDFENVCLSGKIGSRRGTVKTTLLTHIGSRAFLTHFNCEAGHACVLYTSRPSIWMLAELKTSEAICGRIIVSTDLEHAGSIPFPLVLMPEIACPLWGASSERYTRLGLFRFDSQATFWPKKHRCFRAAGRLTTRPPRRRPQFPQLEMIVAEHANKCWSAGRNRPKTSPEYRG